MTLAQLVKIIRIDFINDKITPNQKWDDAFFIRSFSEAQKQACNRTDFIFSNSINLTLANGVSSYLLPTNLTRIIALTFECYELPKVLVEQLAADWRLWTGFSESRERKYMVRGNKVVFVPTPNAVDIGLLVNIEGYYQPDAFTVMSDSPSIPLEFHKELKYWVLYEIYSNYDYTDAQDERKANDSLAKFNAVFGDPVPSNVRHHQFETNMR